MKQFNVEVEETKTYTYLVTAKSVEDAEDKVQNILDRYFAGYESKTCELVDDFSNSTEIQDFTEEVD